MSQYKLFVPDTEKWTRYYMLQVQGKLKPYDFVMRNGERQGIMSVDRTLELYDPEWPKILEERKRKEQALAMPYSEQPKINFVSPTQQVVEQAEAQEKRERAIKRRAQKVCVIPDKKVKENTSHKKKKSLPKQGKSDRWKE